MVQPDTAGTAAGEMLSDGNNTYLVDFGADIGTDGNGTRDDMYQACLEELEEDDHEAFEAGYAEVRDDVPDGKPDDLTY